ncbi:unnamed protein product [Cunninghamella echinulata]
MTKPLCIPTPVLKQIFYYISSQRYLAQYALVCKAWKVYAKKKLYDSIHFYSLHQFIHFLSLADLNYEQDAYLLVRKVTFHFDILHTKEHINDLTTTHYSKLFVSNQKSTICFADLMGKLNQCCPIIKSIHLLDKEKHMKHIRYNMEQQDNGSDNDNGAFTQFLGWKVLDYLPFWHKDQQWDIVTELMEGRRYFTKMDIYATLSGMRMIQYGYFIFPNYNFLNQLYIDFFHPEKTFIMDRAIFHAINQSCPSLISLTLTNVIISIPDTHFKFDPQSYLRPDQPLPVLLPSLTQLHNGTNNNNSNNNSNNNINNNKMKKYVDQEYDDHRLYLPTARALNNIQFNQVYQYRPLHTITLTELNPLCPPNPSLQQLILKNVNFLQPLKTILYFISHYPHVTTLELINMDFTLDHGHTSETERMEKRDDLRRAVFRLFMGFKQLSKFSFTLHPAISRTCARAIWPHYELLTWLSDHPKQLTSLTWPCDLFEKNDDDYDYDHHPSYFHSILPWSTNYNVQNRLHLQSLLELDITLGPYCGQEVAIHSYLDGSTSTLPLLNTLSISYIQRPSSLKKKTTTLHSNLDDNGLEMSEEQIIQLDKINSNNNKKIDIFAWLDICPQLKHLTLKGMDLVNTGGHDLKVDEATRLKMKKERQEQTYTYPLNKLTLEQVDIYMDNGLDDICTRCPKLKVLWCDYINCRWNPISIINYMKDYNTFCEQPIFTIHALSLALDTLYLGHINNVFQDYNYTFTIGKAMVYELGKSALSYFKVMDSQYKRKKEEEDEPIPFIEIHCRLVDQVTWIGHSDQHDRDAFRGFLLQQKSNPDHIHLASLSRKGLKAYQEDKKDMEEWEYLDTNDELVYNEEEDDNDDDDGDDDDVNKYETIEKEIEYNEEKDEEGSDGDDDDYDGLEEEEDDHDEEFLLF